MKTVAKKAKVPDPKKESRLHELVRDYCLRERGGEDVGSEAMVEAWRRICRAVGVRP